MSLSKKLPEYVFRGTTIGWPGNNNAQTHKFTCTSWHPVKALWFALECFGYAPENAVVYVARTDKLKNISPIYNVLKKVESEIGFNIKPVDFYPYCDGYIHIADLQIVINEMNIESNNVARIDNITELCRKTKEITVKEIVILVDGINKYLKTP